MSDCRCENYNTEATSTPCVPIFPEIGCNRIRMFFGYETGPNTDKIIPGQLTKLYYTNSIDDAYIRYGFIISDYSGQELVDSGILPTGFGKQNTNYFDLSELELLATASWESWIMFLENELVLIQDINNSTDFRTFGFYCLKALGFDILQLKNDGFKLFQALKDNDVNGIVGITHKSLINAPRTSPYQADRGEYYPYNLNLLDCAILRRASDIEKLISCYEWIKKIHDTYYGLQFLVRIGDPVSYSNADLPTDTICIKDDNGNYPSFSRPYFIDGDGSAQGYYLSDIVDNSGGFPDKEDQHIIGLSNLDWIQTENGKVGCFAKIGKYATLSDACGEGVYTQVFYPKFALPDHLDILRDQWKINIENLNPESFYLTGLQEVPDTQGTGSQFLYLSAEASERFYVDDNGTWAHFTLSSRVPMSKIVPSNAQGFILYESLGNALQTIPGYDDSVTITQNAFKKFLTYTDQDSNTHGARGNVSILNQIQTNSFCLIPEAIALPMKSNLYKYGPFSSGDAQSGGADIINDLDIVPWNFIQANKNSLPVDYAYERMHEIGLTLAGSSPRDLQKLEKGKITVAGLPCYDLAYWVDNKECYNENELGPTLLTDISVEYGSGGFSTTYNFSTYSPRLGKPEKYIVEAWKDSIKDTQYLNKYLRSLQKNIDINNQSYKLRLINGEAKKRSGIPDEVHLSPKFKKDTTLNTLMFAGYQLKINPTPSPDFDNYKDIEIYETPINDYSAQADCEDYICTTPTPIDYTPVIFTAPPNRLYTFAGTDKAYTIEYIQNTYHQLSAMSLDGFHLPVSLRGANKDPNIKEYLKWPNNSATPLFPPNQFQLDSEGSLIPNPQWSNSARLPRFAKRCKKDGSFVEWDALISEDNSDINTINNPGNPIPSKTRDEIPPFKINTISGQEICYALQINQRYLNPILSAKNLLGDALDKVEPWDDRKNNSSKGFVISSILFGQDHIDYQITHTDPDDVSSNNVQYTDEFIRQQFKNFRFPALRGPLVLQGWGYDTTGKPIPNSADGFGHAQMGEFRKENLTDKFMENWLQYPKSWPVGPIDLRFDRERGVWTCPSPNKIVVARLKEKLLPNSSAKAELINPEAGAGHKKIRFYENYSISGPNGENVKLSMENTEITVYDFLGIDLCQCDIVYAYYDDNRYIVLESDRAYKDPNEPCYDINCTTTTTTTTTVTTETVTTPTPECDWCGLDCLKTVQGYKGTNNQLLGHDAEGCLKWFDITTCDETSSGTTTPIPLP